MTTPYKIYKNNDDYFAYTRITKERPFLPRFGLKVMWTWTDFWSDVEKLNDPDTIYKVIFLARHALGTNTLPDDGETNQQDAVPKRDSPLVQQGYVQASDVQALWTTEQGENLGIPDISYCSPSMRALATNSITFAPLLGTKGDPQMTTLVYEICREKESKNDKHQINHRLSKDCIQRMFPEFTMDSTLAELDPLWVQQVDEAKSAATETNQAKQILDRIFKSEASKKRFVSITGHGAINDAILDVVGFKESSGLSPSSLTQHGGVFAFICGYTSGSDGKTLENGLYKIQFVNKPNFFANSDGTDDDKIVAKDITKLPYGTIPSTWNVNLVDSDKKTYTIQLQDTNSYWNQKADDDDSSDEYVVLSGTSLNWQLTQGQDAGEYTIVPVASSTQDSTQEDGDDTDTDDDTAKYVSVADDGDLISFSSDSSPKWNFIPAWAQSK